MSSYKSRKVPNAIPNAELDDILPDAVSMVNSMGLDLYENIDGASNLFSPLAFALQVGLIQLGKIKNVIPYVYDSNKTSEKIDSSFFSDRDTLEEFKKILKTVPESRFTCELTYPEVSQDLYDKLVNSMAVVIPPDVDAGQKFIASTYHIELKFRDPFYEIDTVKMMFHQTNELAFMHRFGSYMYFSGPKMRILILPLIDSDYEFIVVLPKAYEQEDNLDYSINDVPYPPIAELEEYINNASLTDVDVYLPKFRRDNELELKIPAEKIDLHLGFNINHTTTLIVSDEESLDRIPIESTNSDWRHKLPEQLPHTVFKANHIFVYIVRHNKSGLFVAYGDFQG
jgi:serpin B/serpin B11/12